MIFNKGLFLASLFILTQSIPSLSLDCHDDSSSSDNGCHNGTVTNVVPITVVDPFPGSLDISQQTSQQSQISGTNDVIVTTNTDTTIVSGGNEILVVSENSNDGCCNDSNGTSTTIVDSFPGSLDINQQTDQTCQTDQINQQDCTFDDLPLPVPTDDKKCKCCNKSKCCKKSTVSNQTFISTQIPVKSKLKTKDTPIYTNVVSKKFKCEKIKYMINDTDYSSSTFRFVKFIKPLNNVTFAQSKVLYEVFFDGDLTDVVFDNVVRIKDMRFRKGIKLTNVSFFGAHIRDANFDICIRGVWVYYNGQYVKVRRNNENTIRAFLGLPLRTRF